MDVSLSELQELVIDRKAWRAVIHGVAKSWTRLSDWTELNWTDHWKSSWTNYLHFPNLLYYHQVHFSSITKLFFSDRSTKSHWYSNKYQTQWHLLNLYSFFFLNLFLFCEVTVAQSCSTLCNPMDYTVHGILQARMLEWIAIPFSRGFFPNQGSNPGLLHCRQILYQLSHQGHLTDPASHSFIRELFSLKPL